MKKYIKEGYLKIALVALIVNMIYLPTFMWMWVRWFRVDSYYSHGLLVPFVVLYLIWNRRKEIASVVSQPRNDKGEAGLYLIVPALFIHLSSAWMKIYFTSGFSLILLIIGLVLYFFGPILFRKLLYPILFLLFMVPMPLVLVANVSVKMKLFATQLSTLVLNSIGISATRDGNIIRTMHSYMVVDSPCSGLRSLISLLALGVLFSYFMNTNRVKKWALLLLTIPIAICANVFRISFLTAVTEIYGPSFAGGWFHDFSGLLLFSVAFLALIITKKVLEWTDDFSA